jgi:hypothetical protein
VTCVDFEVPHYVSCRLECLLSLFFSDPNIFLSSLFRLVIYVSPWEQETTKQCTRDLIYCICARNSKRHRVHISELKVVLFFIVLRRFVRTYKTARKTSCSSKLVPVFNYFPCSTRIFMATINVRSKMVFL